MYVVFFSLCLCVRYSYPSQPVSPISLSLSTHPAVYYTLSLYPSLSLCPGLRSHVTTVKLPPTHSTSLSLHSLTLQPFRDEELYQATMKTVKAVVAMSGGVETQPVVAYVGLIKEVGLALRELLGRVDTIKGCFPQSEHEEVGIHMYLLWYG